MSVLLLILVTSMLCVWMTMDHSLVLVAVDILEMDSHARVSMYCTNSYIISTISS